MSDCFRPVREPARTIYDAFQKEAELRPKREVWHWIEMERKAVWSAARDYAQQHGLRVPTLDDVQKAEVQGLGHVDYAAKWAYALSHAMTSSQPSNPAEE